LGTLNNWCLIFAALQECRFSAITAGGIREKGAYVAHPRTPSMLSALSENWWALALRGFLAVLFGFAALFLPLDTLAAVGRAFGAYAILEGTLVVLIGMRGARYRGAFIGEGASGVVAGLVILAWPGITALVLLYVVAIWAILSGVAEMIAAVLLRREIEGEWALFLVGVLSVALGAAMAFLPGVGLPSLVWLVGVYALAVGVALVALAFRVRGLQRRERGRVA
jgi:uncharacterized membrane protein HdeD (DUF308 family)